jgi:glycosyltransferase involved in cell wall biosynthesis
VILGVDALRLLGQRSGVGRVLEALLAHLDGAGHSFGEVRLYSPRPLAEDFRLPDAAQGHVVRSPLPPGLWQQITLPRAHGRAGVLLCPSYVIPLASAAPTLLIHHGSYEGYAQAFSFWRRTRARILHTLSARYATRIVTVSEHSKRDILRFYGVDSGKVEVIPNGVDTERFHPLEEPGALEDFRRATFGDDHPFVLYVGKLTKRRNLEALTEAFAHFQRRSGTSHRLLFVGFELEGTSVLEVARRCGIEHRVHALSHACHRELALIYNAADLMAYPSSYEGFGLPVLEAMACGTPALALDRTAFPEFARGAALLLPDARVETLADGLEKILSDPARQRQMRENGLRRVDAYRWQDITARYVKVLDGLARAYHHGG